MYQSSQWRKNMEFGDYLSTIVDWKVSLSRFVVLASSRYLIEIKNDRENKRKKNIIIYYYRENRNSLTHKYNCSITVSVPITSNGNSSSFFYEFCTCFSLLLNIDPSCSKNPPHFNTSSSWFKDFHLRC